MGLDIQFTTQKKVLCPHCGEIVKTEDGYSVESSGRAWRSILEELGYYVPYEKRTEENDWYGRDMKLTGEQLEKVYQFIRSNPELYQSQQVLGLIAAAKCDGDTVILNADW